MIIKRLSLHGFKSFADRTELEFNPGMTAIVGPNGCGKSNISDAIRWVLGEQRASAIRSSKMEEAIFQGTTERRAVNRAEVSMRVTNEDGVLPVSYDEVEISRTVFREGGSDYELNRSPCRLRDILDMCRDTGLGANSYAVIEQGMVDAVLSDRADDRRQMFEEAAGIGRYKDRRKAARRRLDSAEADLARLEDVVAEVETSVRSLAQQRGRARRYQELRTRRLALEVAVAAGELEEAERALERIGERLESLGQDEPAARAALRAAEAELEQHRLQATEVHNERSGAAGRLDDVNRRIADRERELAVAEERRTHARSRIEQIGGERERLRVRIDELDREVERAAGEQEGEHARLDEVGERLEEAQDRRETLRETLGRAREADDEARRTDEELSRRLAELDAAATGAEARAEDIGERRERLGEEKAELERELARLDEQGDLFADRVRELNAEAARLEDERDACSARLDALRTEADAARTSRVEAEDRADRLSSQLGALEALERDFEGYAPAVAELLAARERLEGRLTPLSELLQLPPERAAALEDALASLLQILVVDAPATREEVRRYVADHAEAEGTLAVLPQEEMTKLEALLDALEFAGTPPSEPVLVGRRERLERLRAEAAEAEAAREEAAAERVRAAERVAEVEAELEELETRLRSVRTALRELDADESARESSRERTERALVDLERRATELDAAAADARSEAERAREQRARLEEDRAASAAERERTAERRAEREAAWEAVRDEVAELRVDHARRESSVQELERRAAAGREAIAEARTRLESLDREERQHEDAIEELDDFREEASAQLEQLFTERDGLTEQVRGLESKLAEADEAASELEGRVRELRRAAEKQGEERHGLELEKAEAEGVGRRIRERLEAEWDRPFEQLVQEAEPVEGEPDELKAELRTVATDIERLGPVNMLAIEQYDEEKERLEFLQSQREDLLQAKEDLQTAIDKINRAARERFMETFEQIRTNFHETFQTLFQGGESDLWLADADRPLESAIEISASPGGKRTQRIHLLSGGERALTSLALLFAIYLVKPSPFCVLDEVDAPLDEANIERLLGMLDTFKEDTQFILITHNPRTIEAADWVYGVTMEEPGISTIVGVQLDEVLDGAGVASV